MQIPGALYEQSVVEGEGVEENLSMVRGEVGRGGLFGHK